jgi:hypothetical protein
LEKKFFSIGNGFTCLLKEFQFILHIRHTKKLKVRGIPGDAAAYGGESRHVTVMLPYYRPGQALGRLHEVQAPRIARQSAFGAG